LMVAVIPTMATVDETLIDVLELRAQLTVRLEKEKGCTQCSD
jgi:hypothetical protein